MLYIPCFSCFSVKEIMVLPHRSGWGVVLIIIIHCLLVVLTQFWHVAMVTLSSEPEVQRVQMHGICVWVWENQPYCPCKEIRFFTVHEQNGTSREKLLNVMFNQAALKWSSFAGCFSEVKRQSVRAVWYPNGGLASLGMAGSSCTALWCWIKLNFFSL